MGAQFGIDFANALSATLNVVSVDLVQLNLSIDTDTPNWVNYSVDIIGVDGLHIENEVSVGAGLPVLGDVEVALKNSFTDDLNGHVIQDKSETGFSVDVDAAKVSGGAKFLVGADAEFNVDFIEGNTFKALWNGILDIWNSIIQETTNDNE